MVVATNGFLGKRERLPEEVNRLKPDWTHCARKLFPGICVFLYCAIGLGCGLVGFIGMSLLWHLAPWIYLIGVVMKILGSPVQPWHVRNGWRAMLSELELFLDGVLLTAVLFGPFAHLFQ